MILIFLLSAGGYSQDSTGIPVTMSKSGLESLTGKRLCYHIDSLANDVKEIGLTEDRIKTEIESKIRGVELTPMVTKNLYGGYLDVKINIIETVYSIEMSFLRTVKYFLGGKPFLKSDVPTWIMFKTGLHNNNFQKITGTLSESLDEFLNEYLKTNPGATR